MKIEFNNDSIQKFELEIKDYVPKALRKEYSKLPEVEIDAVLKNPGFGEFHFNQSSPFGYDEMDELFEHVLATYPSQVMETQIYVESEDEDIGFYHEVNSNGSSTLTVVLMYEPFQGNFEIEVEIKFIPSKIEEFRSMIQKIMGG